MFDEAGVQSPSTERKAIGRGLIAAALVLAACTILYLLSLVFTGLGDALEPVLQHIAIWLKSPVSSLRVWHLIAIVWFVSAITRSR